MSRHPSPTDFLPFPFEVERRSHFLLRWVRAAQVKKLYGGESMKAGFQRWEEAKAQSEVSIKTLDDQFLVFEDS